VREEQERVGRERGEPLTLGGESVADFARTLHASDVLGHPRHRERSSLILLSRGGRVAWIALALIVLASTALALVRLDARRSRHAATGLPIARRLGVHRRYQPTLAPQADRALKPMHTRPVVRSSTVVPMRSAVESTRGEVSTPAPQPLRLDSLQDVPTVAAHLASIFRAP
jgi:hypothetical protein